jgi:hypothetical protein
VQSCQGSAKRNSYRHYVANVSEVASASVSVGRDLTDALPPLFGGAARVALLSAAPVKQHAVRAGQALERVLLTATVRGLAATPMTQPTEVPEVRRLLADPRRQRAVQAVLRIGYGPQTVPTPRRPISDVLD